MLEGGYAHTVFWGPYLNIKKDSQISASGISRGKLCNRNPLKMSKSEVGKAAAFCITKRESTKEHADIQRAGIWWRHMNIESSRRGK
jgi:hypothetical protein